MPEHTESDTRFALPAIDDPAPIEIGVILSGLDIERLLAGLGAAGEGEDPTAVTLRVDRYRHGEPDKLAAAVRAGAHRWRAARPALAAVDRVPPVSASIRQAWQRARRTVLAADPAGTNHIAAETARFAYLTACWLRCAEVDAEVDAAVDAEVDAEIDREEF